MDCFLRYCRRPVPTLAAAALGFAGGLFLGDLAFGHGHGGGLDGRGFGAAATPLDGGGRLDGSDWSLDGGATQGYRSGRFAGTVDPPGPKAKPQPAKND